MLFGAYLLACGQSDVLTPLSTGACGTLWRRLPCADARGDVGTWTSLRSRSAARPSGPCVRTCAGRRLGSLHLVRATLFSGLSIWSSDRQLNVRRQSCQVFGMQLGPLVSFAQWGKKSVRGELCSMQQFPVSVHYRSEPQVGLILQRDKC